MLQQIDVILPFHKFDNQLLEAIKSCHDSVGVDLRLICINDSSLSISHGQLGLKSGDLLLSTSGREGYTAAIGLGVRKSKAPFIGFLDSDDLTSNDRFANQVNSLRNNNLSISTCRIIKMSANGRQIRNFLSLPKPPQYDDSALSLLFGAYGADSTLVCSGEFLRNIWASHQNFPSHLADYGWLMKECLGKEIHFENSGKYFYRMHSLQMSRESNLSEEWPAIYPYWMAWLKNLSHGYPKTSTLKISPNVALMLAFPSSLVKLSKIEKAELISFCKTLESEITTGSKHAKRLWKSLIYFRLLVGTRSIRYAKPSVVLKITVRTLMKLRAVDNFRVSTNA